MFNPRARFEGFCHGTEWGIFFCHDYRREYICIQLSNYTSVILCLQLWYVYIYIYVIIIIMIIKNNNNNIVYNHNVEGSVVEKGSICSMPSFLGNIPLQIGCTERKLLRWTRRSPFFCSTFLRNLAEKNSRPNGGFHSHGGTPIAAIAGWFKRKIPWKSHEDMDDN